MKPIDIFICAYLRPLFTEQTIVYLKERTKYPYRLFLINNGGNEDIARVYRDEIFMTINMSKNAGVTAAWNMALSLAESDYFITSDNDIYVPSLNPDWLSQLVNLMDLEPSWGAISLHPHVLIGAEAFSPNDHEEVKQVNMCGAVMRIMRRDAVWKASGWKDDDPLIRGDRGHEERTICSRLQSLGYMTGRTTRIRAYHPFGKTTTGGNWGYPDEITPEQQGHNPDLKDYVLQFDNMESYDEKTWIPK